MTLDTPKPFLKWAGGKGQLLAVIDRSLPIGFKKYFEPFLGGGAVFFHLYRQGFRRKATLSDLNEELMNAYRTICNSVDELIEELKSGTYEPKKDVFYSIRAWDRNERWNEVDKIRQTARMIYLNRTCYNGLYRVNQKGYFNVPYGGYKNPTICDEYNLVAVSKSLRNTYLLSMDFTAALESAQKNDFVYIDPPYQPVTETASFTDYTALGFGESEQKRLAMVYRDLHKRGCLCLKAIQQRH